MRYVMVMAVLAILAMGIAVAQPVKIKDDMAPMQKYQEVKEKYQGAKEAYEKAKEQYAGVAQEHRNLENKTTFDKARKFLHSGASMAERWLERLRVHVENLGTDVEIKEEVKLRLLAQINESIAKIEEKKRKIDEASSPEELRESARELRDAWREVKVTMKSVAGQIAVIKVKTVIDKAELVQLKLEERIEELNVSGVDTSRLVALLEEYSTKLDLAKQKLEEANETFVSMTPENADVKFREGHMLIREATQYIREAFQDVRQIVRELNQIKVGKIFFGNETGEVWVRGEGNATFTGTAIVVIRGNATIDVEPEDAIVTLVGFGVKSVEGGVSRISGEGTAVIRGENITVKVEGGDFKLVVKGFGTLFLDGKGIFRVKESPQAEMSEETPYDGTITIEFGGG